MRIRGKAGQENLDYLETKRFFENRGNRYDENNPYMSVLYQDNNPEIVPERNRAEIARLLPLLQLDSRSKVLDLGCGIGRWSDAITADIQEYCGIDFSENLIELANSRAHGKGRCFYVGAVNEFREVLIKNQKDKYNRMLLIGILMYTNDENLPLIMNQVIETADEHSIICIREPVGIEERLTLKDYYSEELKDNYNAIYRTRDEWMELFEKTLIKAGFKITQSDFLFSDHIQNNRKETAHYYFILER